MSVEERLSKIEKRLGAIEKQLTARRKPQISWLKYWLFTTDHKQVGILYFVTSFYFLFIGGILALLMRTQLAFPLNTLLTGAAYNQAVSMHGLIMVLWFLSPLGAAFANYFVPLQIGAKDVAFPRFNAFSYWMYAFGGLVAISGFFVPGGAAAAGWTNYAPLNSKLFLPGGGETLIGLGLLMMWGSLTMGGVNLVSTILVMRAPGMTWM
ncbi:MAG: cbb3-type cytochrome c oxidase subunit I, partial [Candidatus Bathyarchaeia archaeon]